ncbi:endonuclease/exonuclease/phosphatase family protein [Ensifer adhaerens]|uniref:endonuclease/exonuclease/phosphatase family protein n=1 Tax=Ensifer adhaerens TaxID=106592 RepID=UPI003F84821D
MKSWGATLAIALLFSGQANAFTLATWNAAGGTVESIAEREDDVKRLGAEYRKAANALPDVLVLQEITSFAAARKIADFLGYKDATIATSNVGDDSEVWPLALEIAIISKQPFVSVDSFQTLKVVRGVKQPPERPFIESQATGVLTKGTGNEVQIPSAITAINTENPSRGILRVELGDGTVVYGVHLASSGLATCRAFDTATSARDLEQLARSFGLDEDAAAVGRARDAVLAFHRAIPDTGIPATVNETLKRAKQREAGAGAVSALASADVAAAKSVYIAGDFNTPLNEPCKTGSKLGEDFAPQIGCKPGVTPNTCGPTDGYDDTFAILTGTLVGSAELMVLTKHLDRTYVKPAFVNSPIDNILVGGPAAKKAHQVSKIKEDPKDNKVFGSDHFSVLAIRE